MGSGPPPQHNVLERHVSAGPRTEASRVRTSGKGAEARAGSGGGGLEQRPGLGGSGAALGRRRPKSAAQTRDKRPRDGGHSSSHRAAVPEVGVASLYVPESRLRRSKEAVNLNLDRIPSVNELSRLSMYLTRSQHFVLMQHIRSVQRISALAVKI